MGELSERQKIGFSLAIDAQSQDFNFLFQDMRLHGLDVIKPETAHVTLLYPSEASVITRSTEHSDEIDAAIRQADAFLVSKYFGVKGLMPDPRELTALKHSKRRVGVFLAERSDLYEVRQEIMKILVERADVRVIPKRNYVAHLTLGWLAKGGSRELPDTFKAPEKLKVTNRLITQRKVILGAEVQIDTDLEKPEYDNARQPYVNKSVCQRGKGAH